MHTACPICATTTWSAMYTGPIRMGRFGDWSPEARTVHRCEGCGAGWLPGKQFDYEGEEYRVAVDSCADIDGYHQLHDPEQAEKLAVIGVERLRGKIVADLGCGGGAFLDVACGPARRTVAVEPCAAYHEVLRQRHDVFSWAADAVGSYAGQVDLVVSFAVIEHVPDPRGFLEDVYRLLRPGGEALISTPNADDWMLDLLPDAYGRFFYRKAHQWYFNAASLGNLARLAGLTTTRCVFRQRFDLSNALLWLRDGRPSGLGRIAHLQNLDPMYRHELETAGRADFLYAWLRKDA